MQSQDQSISTSIAQSVRAVLAKSKDVGSSPTRGKTFVFWSLKSLQPIRKSPTFIGSTGLANW